MRNVYQIDDLRITQPDVALERDASGVTNFAKLAPPAPAAKPEAKDEEKSPAARPDRQASRNRRRQSRFRRPPDGTALPIALTNLGVTVDDFSTLAKTPAHYTLKTVLDTSGTLNASGGFTLAAKTADLKLAIDGLALPPLQPYIDNAVAARVAEGALGVRLPVSVDWSKPEPEIQVGAGEVTLKSLKLVPKANAASVALASAVAKIQKIDVGARTAALDSVQLNGLSVDATRRKDGTIDLAALAGPPQRAPEPSAVHKIQKAQAAGPAWRYQVGQIALADSTANFTDSPRRTPSSCMSRR